MKNITMRKLAGKVMAGMLTAALAVTSMTGISADAAKKPVLSRKSVRLKEGQRATVSIKNSHKKAKVTWKSSKTKFVKITKRKSGKKAAVTFKAVKAGSSVVSATYKLGKKKTVLKCNVKVTTKAAAARVATPAPIISTQTSAPTAVPTAAPTVAPTAEPTAEPTVTAGPDIWVTTWGTAEEPVENQDGVKNFIPLAKTTVRQIIKVTTSGDKFKLRLSNQYGKSSVQVESMHIAKQGARADQSDIITSTDTVVTVNGKASFEIPAGKVIETDTIDFKVTALENVAISTYFGGNVPTTGVTGHRGARATTYQTPGNEVSTESLGSVNGLKTCTGWFFLADVSLMQPEGSKAVVCFGDSITDGYGTDASYLGKKPDSYTRWGDYFAKRLQANESTKNVSVINEGIGGNAIFGGLGPAGKDRFKRDLLEHDGVAYCIILFGVNDLDKLPNADKFNTLKPEYEKMIALCHANNIKVYAAPILPFGKSGYYSEGSEGVRQLINNWFRSTESGVDGIIDFESAVADPDNPKNVREEYTHSDGLHPYDGYEAMANAIDLEMFEK